MTLLISAPRPFGSGSWFVVVLLWAALAACPPRLGAAPPTISPAPPPREVLELADSSSAGTSSASGTGAVLCPVRGHILASYGAKSACTHNDGMNIAAPRGTEVQAVDAGVVAYTG